MRKAEYLARELERRAKQYTNPDQFWLDVIKELRSAPIKERDWLLNEMDRKELHDENHDISTAFANLLAAFDRQFPGAR